MTYSSSAEILMRIRDALEAAAFSIAPFIPGSVKPEYKVGDDPVTEADRRANLVLHKALVRNDEGWLSEESTERLDPPEKRPDLGGGST